MSDGELARWAQGSSAVMSAGFGSARELNGLHAPSMQAAQQDRGGASRRERDARDQASKGIWWMPWHQEAMKDVARCEKPRGDASDR